MEEAHRVEDIEAPPLSKSMQRNTNRGKTNEASLSEISESMQRNTLWGNTNEANNFTIFRTPHNISQSKKKLFEPSVISIGPFHHGHKHLQALEDQKWRFLQDFLSRWNHITLDLCIKEMMLLEEKTRRCYNESFVDLKSNAFVEMMLLDGCFVLEYFLKLKDDKPNPIFEVAWNFDFIVLDFLLLENQIPFFIVEKLYEIGFKEKLTMNFVKHIVCYFEVLANNSIDFKISDSIDSSDSLEIHHLVHLFYHYLVPDNPVVKISKSFGPSILPLFSAIQPNSTRDRSPVVIPCATELKHKGMKFRPNSEARHMLDISFEYGVLKIPKLEITDATKPIFANLIAFEHSKYGKKHSTNRKKHSPFTIYVAFLDNLVNTQNDVTILQECKIIENWLGSEEEVTNFINQVTEGNATDEDHYLAELYREVNRFSESGWNRHRAILVRDYFSSPWSAISLVAALILLVLTCVQSFYAVYAYKFPPSS